MKNREDFFRLPEWQSFVKEIRQEINLAKRPADQVIVSDAEFNKLLSISKRTSATMRMKGMITYSKIGGMIFYKLSDILELIDKHRIPCFDHKLQILWEKKTK